MNWSALLVELVPPGVVTVTWTTPVPAGLFAVTVVALTATTLVAAATPNATAVAPVRFVPVIVTGVPASPEVGVNEVIVGRSAGSVNVPPVPVPPSPLLVP